MMIMMILLAFFFEPKIKESLRLLETISLQTMSVEEIQKKKKKK